MLLWSCGFRSWGEVRQRGPKLRVENETWEQQKEEPKESQVTVTETRNQGHVLQCLLETLQKLLSFLYVGWLNLSVFEHMCVHSALARCQEAPDTRGRSSGAIHLCLFVSLRQVLSLAWCSLNRLGW